MKWMHLRGSRDYCKREKFVVAFENINKGNKVSIMGFNFENYGYNYLCNFGWITSIIELSLGGKDFVD